MLFTVISKVKTLLQWNMAYMMEMKKWSHNRWVDEKISQGWRYGAYFNSREKTHPAMQNWDQLSESHRRSPEFTDVEILEWIHKNNRSL
jgi:hypothetical protein